MAANMSIHIPKEVLPYHSQVSSRVYSEPRTFSLVPLRQARCPSSGAQLSLISPLFNPLSKTTSLSRIAYFDAMDEDYIVIEEIDDQVDNTEYSDRDDIDFNSAKQTLHPKEEAFGGKNAIDIPTFTAFERILLAATSQLRSYLHCPQMAKISVGLLQVVTGQENGQDLQDSPSTSGERSSVVVA